MESAATAEAGAAAYKEGAARLAASAVCALLYTYQIIYSATRTTLTSSWPPPPRKQRPQKQQQQQQQARRRALAGDAHYIAWRSVRSLFKGYTLSTSLCPSILYDHSTSTHPPLVSSAQHTTTVSSLATSPPRPSVLSASMARNPCPRASSSRHCLSSIHTHTSSLAHLFAHTTHTEHQPPPPRCGAPLYAYAHTIQSARSNKTTTKWHTHTTFRLPKSIRRRATPFREHARRPQHTPDSILRSILFLLPSLFLFTTGLASRATPQGPTPQEATTWPARCCCRYSPSHSPRPTRRRAIEAYSLARSGCRERGQG